MFPQGPLRYGENTGFALVNNSIHENQNGAIFLNGEISDGVIEGNRIENNSGARNLTAGLVLCSMPIEDIETAYNPFPDEMLYDILQSPHQLVVRGNTVAQNHSSGIYSESGYLNYYVENTIYKNEKEGMCLDYGSFGNYITGCEIRQNGGRNRMSDEDLEADFILDQGRMADGSSPPSCPASRWITPPTTPFTATLCGTITVPASRLCARRSATPFCATRSLTTTGVPAIPSTFLVLSSALT